MDVDLPIARVHSIAEAYLYVKTLTCPACGKGPLRTPGDITRHTTAESGWRLAAECLACRRMHVAGFIIEPPPTRQQAASDCINPTPEPSEAIDLLGWLQLFQTILKASQEEADREAARRLAWESAQCLDEALKFYDEGEELPRESAFFSDTSKARFREHPGHFARSVWRQRRIMLPHARPREAPSGPADSRWWHFWKRGRAE